MYNFNKKTERGLFVWGILEYYFHIILYELHTPLIIANFWEDTKIIFLTQSFFLNIDRISLSSIQNKREKNLYKFK